MSTVINGVAIRWALQSDIAITETAVGTMIFTSFDHTKMDEPDTIKNQSGQTCTRIWPDASDEVTFSGFIKGTSLSDAKVQQKLVALGTLVHVTFTQAEYPAITTGSVFEVQSGKISFTNTSAAKIDMTLRLWPLISTAAS